MDVFRVKALVENGLFKVQFRAKFQVVPAKKNVDPGSGSERKCSYNYFSPYLNVLDPEL